MRFFLDNCLPPRWAPALSALVKEEGHSVIHLSEKFPRNEPDAQWIAKLATENQQIVIISGDERITRNPHERTAWKQAGLTAFFLASGWAHLKFWEKTWMFVRWFPTLLKQSEIVAPGAGFIVPVHYGPNKLKSV